MSPMPTELVEDPLFQLNVLLWLTQPLPVDNEITPIFHRQGFIVYAISPLLTVPLDMRLAAQQAQIAVQDSFRPDAVLAHEPDRKFAFIECKKSSFGVASSTAQQALAILLAAGERASEPLGLGAADVKESVVGYLLPTEQGTTLYQTLSQLTETLSSHQMRAARFTILALQADANDLSMIIDDAGAAFFSLESGSNPIMRLESDTDPRPLYFIPYDPDVTYSSEREKDFCKRVLFERLHSAILVAVGRANPPAELILGPDRLLNDATFGMYAQWENRDSARHMRGLCRQLMRPLTQSVNSVAQGVVRQDERGAWAIKLDSFEQQEKVIDALTRFACETLDLRTEAEPELFE